MHYPVWRLLRERTRNNWSGRGVLNSRPLGPEKRPTHYPADVEVLKIYRLLIAFSSCFLERIRTESAAWDKFWVPIFLDIFLYFFVWHPNSIFVSLAHQIEFEYWITETWYQIYTGKIIDKGGKKHEKEGGRFTIFFFGFFRNYLPESPSSSTILRREID